MLTADKIRYENGVKISEKIIPDNAVASKYVAAWCKAGWKMKPCKSMEPIGITIHNTGDLKNVHDDAEQYTRATYPNCNMGGVIVHYYVDDTGAWQNLRETETGWHASDGNGPGNTKTIAIECIMDGSGSQEDLKSRDNAARLIASIMKRHNWNISNLYTHNHWMGLPDSIAPNAKKNCPIYLLPKYKEFKELISTYLDALNTQSSEKVESIYEEINVGDILEFTGDKQYLSANASIGRSAKSSRVKVTKKYLESSKYPIHVRSINDKGEYISGIYGWVSLDDLSPIFNPYTVKITTDALNYRTGPSASYKIVGTIRDRGVYTIIQEKNGWGQLKSKVGWINLYYTKKI